MKKALLCRLLLLGLLISLAIPCIGIAFAQDTEPIVPVEGKTLLQVVGAWLLYSIVGMVASLVQPDGKFDAYKFIRSFLWAIIVALLAIGLGLHPTAIETQYSNFITEIVNFVANSGFGISLLYTFEKFYTIATGLAAKVKQTATAPGT